MNWFLVTNFQDQDVDYLETISYKIQMMTAKFMARKICDDEGLDNLTKIFSK